MAAKKEKDFDKTTIGGRIAALRATHDMTQNELAEKMGLFVDSKKISKIENNRTDPSCWELVKLAKILHTTTDYILTGKDATQNPNSFTLTLAEQRLILDLAKRIQGC